MKKENADNSNKARADAAENNVSNVAVDHPGRRMEDTAGAKKRARNLNLDRRVKNNDRRIHDDPNYKGPSRRATIDRRETLKDRRGS